MADETKKRRKRVKGSGSGKATTSSGRVTAKAAPSSSRYTAPIPVHVKHSSRWVPIFMFTFFGIGVLVIILNYLPGHPLLPGPTSNWYLLGGLGSICLGFACATRYH